MAAVAAAAALILGVPAAPDAQSSVKIGFADGRVSLFVDGASASTVLAEWSRYGKTEVVGAELVEKKRVTLALDEVSEGEALEAILGRDIPFAAVPRRAESGVSSFGRLLIGEAALRELAPVDTSIPPEARYAYTVPERAQSGENFGKPEYEKLNELPPAPEVRFDYFAPEKATGDYGRPVFEKMDERWIIPEVRFEFFLKDFAKFDIADFLRPPTTYPEVRFKYFCGPKAEPCW